MLRAGIAGLERTLSGPLDPEVSADVLHPTERFRMSPWIRRPSPAMVVACIALAFALAGTGISAVTQLVPRNSVGTVQLMDSAVARAKLRDNAVTSTKVADRSLRAIDFAKGEVPAGPAGPQGETGPPGPFPDVLPPGKTIRALARYANQSLRIKK